MPGLPTGGIVSIPNDFELRRAETNGSVNGEWINFKVQYSDKDHKGNNFFHLFRASMWVPGSEINKCLEVLKPGRFFRITAHLDAKVRDDSQYDPVPQLRIDYKYFVPTKIGTIE